MNNGRLRSASVSPSLMPIKLWSGGRSNTSGAGTATTDAQPERRSRGSSRWRHSHPTGPTTPSPTDLVPVEIIFEVFGYLDTATLRTLSLVSKRSNELIIPLLWRSFKITDSGILRESTAPLHWRRGLTEMCNAVSQSPGRAAQVRRLTINIAGSPLLWTLFGSSVMRSLSKVLCATSSLESLVAHLPDRDTPRGRAAMVHALCLQPAQFNFRLREFECDSPMEPEIFQFLKHQPSIERYAVRRSARPPKPQGGSELPGPLTTRGRSQSLPSRLTNPRPTILPSLRHFTGPPPHIRTMLKGRHNMESVHVYCDIPPVEAAEIATMEPTNSRPVPALLARSSPLAETKRLILSRGWSLEREIQIDVAPAVKHIYGIAPQSIRNLRFEYFLIRETDIPHNFELLAPEQLKEFSSLEAVEWNCCFFGDFQGERNGEPRVEFSEEWAVDLVRRCEACCPSLASLSITRMSSSVLSLVRAEEGEVDQGPREESSVQLRVPGGRLWTLTVAAPSLKRQFSW